MREMASLAKNPLDAMTWEQRFYAALEALLAMEMKYDDLLAQTTMIRRSFYGTITDEQRAENLGYMREMEALRNRQYRALRRLGVKTSLAVAARIERSGADG